MFLKILDIYYKKPFIFDVIINVVIILGALIVEKNSYYKFEFDSNSQMIPSIGITISGFILTMLTILLTLKSNSIISNDKNKNSPGIYENNFKVFLSSNLYSKSITILKNGVIYLLMISFLTLGISVILNPIYSSIGLYLNLVCLVSTILVFLRSFYVINLIFKMQTKSP